MMYSREFEHGFILPLIGHLNALSGKDRRAVAIIAAPPAAGKSTLAARIEELSVHTPELERVQALPMDGFHLKQEYLKTHTFIKDGVLSPLTEIKGAPETFDARGLLETVKRIKQGGTVRFPAYDRALHDTVDGAIEVTAGAVVIEGNYMLLKQPVWEELHGYADISIFLRADPDCLLERLINRKLAAGRTREYAEAFARNSDLPNAELILNESAPADIELETDAQGNMTIIRNTVF